tara:strand:+ start:983 stop:2725 length:1743 start_codon:yes stop_codon:yes gene_type:complete
MAQLGEEIPQTMGNEKVVSNSNLGPEIPQVMDSNVPGLEDIPSYLEQVIQNWDVRKEEANQTMIDYQEGNLDGKTGFKPIDSALGSAQKNTQIVGKVIAGTAMDLIGVGIGATIDGISWMIPDKIEDPIKDSLGNAWDWTMSTEGGQAAQEALDGGVEVYGKWKKENPQFAKTFESVVNVGLMLAPMKVKAKTGPVQGAAVPSIGPPQMQNIGSKWISIGSNKATTSAKASADKDKFGKVERLLSPPLDKKNVKALGPEGEPLLNKPTLFGGPTIKATASEAQVVDHLVKMKDIKPGKGAAINKTVIDKDQQRLNKEVAKILIQYSRGVRAKEIPLIKVSDNIDNAVLETLNKLTTLKGSKQVDELTDKYVKAAKEILERNGKTPEGIHKSRVEFDKLINDEVAANTLSAEGLGLTSQIAKAVRDGINKSIDDVIPTSQSIKTRRLEQNLNYRAIDKLAVKIPAEGGQLVSWLQNLNRVNKTRASTASAAVLLGTTVSNPAIWATLAGMAGTVGLVTAGNLLVKGVMSPKTRQALGILLRETDRAIKITRNSEMRKSLKTSRVFVTDLLASMPTEKEQEQ